MREKHGLADDNPLRHLRKHLRWPYSLERRQKAREQRRENLDAPCVYDGLITYIYDRITGIPIFPTGAVRPLVPNSTSWQRYVQFWRGLPETHGEFHKFLSEMDPLAALLDDPDTIDLIGIRETAECLIESFKAYAEAYFSDWSEKSKPYQDFVALLDTIRLQAIEECVVLWPDRGDWVERLVVPTASDRLESAWGEWCDKARAAELVGLHDQRAPKRTHTGVSPDVAIPTQRASDQLVTINGKTLRGVLRKYRLKMNRFSRVSEASIGRLLKEKPVRQTTLDDLLAELKEKGVSDADISGLQPSKSLS
jgi:hypothetical protein